MSGKIDLLNREPFIDDILKVINQLSDNKRGCCFAVEGSWGIGKTFVIENVEEKLREMQNEQSKEDKYFVFHYNCWQYDYYEEPAVAIISAMTMSIQEDNAIAGKNIDEMVKAGGEVVIDKLKKIVGILLENKIGVDLISIAEDTKERKDENQTAVFAFNRMFNFSQTIEKIRKNLQEIAEQRTLVLVVDELDRCIPEYAIKVLERLHHIFAGLDNVIVIAAIDRKQLEHSVEEMFGARAGNNSMDIERYLKKIIDFSMVLDNGTINESLQNKYKYYFERFTVQNEKDIDKGFSMLQKLFAEIDIRSQEKIIEKANLVHSIVCGGQIDVSVLFFEVMYEVLILWGIEDFQFIASLDGESNYEVVMEKIGLNKAEILKDLYENAYTFYTNKYSEKIRYIKGNLLGKVIWYFDFVFNKREGNAGAYQGLYNYMTEYAVEVEIAKKYCEFCKIIK